MSDQSSTLCFTFGDPEPILNSQISDYFGVYLNTLGGYYHPPIELHGLVRIMGANAYHGSIMHFKKNCLKRRFVPTPLLSAKDFELVALDYIVTGNAYLQVWRNGFGRAVKLTARRSLYTRRLEAVNQYCHLNDDGSTTNFMAGEILHLKQPDLKQDIYGIPEYLGGIQSVLLSEDYTLFRRKFILNGNHMGYILVTHDADIDPKTAKLIEKKIAESKGPGNFKSLYLNIGKSQAREPVKVIPIGEIGTNDDIEKIKKITKDEMLGMHRMQPVLSGIIPENVGGFGDIQKIEQVYYNFEETALQTDFMEFNEMLGQEVIRFSKPDWVVNPA